MIYDTLAFRTIVKRANDVVKLELELDLLWFIEIFLQLETAKRQIWLNNMQNKKIIEILRRYLIYPKSF